MKPSQPYKFYKSAIGRVITCVFRSLLLELPSPSLSLWCVSSELQLLLSLISIKQVIDCYIRCLFFFIVLLLCTAEESKGWEKVLLPSHLVLLVSLLLFACCLYCYTKRGLLYSLPTVMDLTLTPCKKVKQSGSCAPVICSGWPDNASLELTFEI